MVFKSDVFFMINGICFYACLVCDGVGGVDGFSLVRGTTLRKGCVHVPMSTHHILG